MDIGIDFPTMLDKYGLSAAVAFLIVTNTLPKIIDGAKWIIEKLTPERMARIKAKNNEDARRAQAAMDKEDFERDLRERDVIAKEQTAKALLLIDAHMQSDKISTQEQLSLLSSGLTAANQSLAVLLDRTMQRRASDFTETK